MSAADKIRVLCLHGYRQNASKLRGRISSFRRAFKTNVEFVCVDGPLVVPYEPTSEEHIKSMEESEQGADEEKQQFSWWNYQENENGTHSYSHVEESLEYVAAICREQGPFDGVFGFSQGGMIAHLMLQRHHENPKNSPFAFSFGIFVSSPTSLDPRYGTVDYKLAIPSVHVIGETDVIVAPERCKKLTEGFVDPTVILHDGGHYIRTNKEVKDAIRDLLKKV